MARASLLGTRASRRVLASCLRRGGREKSPTDYGVAVGKAAAAARQADRYLTSRKRPCHRPFFLPYAVSKRALAQAASVGKLAG